VLQGDESNKTIFTVFPHTHTHTYHTMHLDIIKVSLPTDAKENCFKRSIKIYIKTAPSCFGVNHHNQGVHYMSLLKQAHKDDLKMMGMFE
jgi:hypothetical protein